MTGRAFTMEMLRDAEKKLAHLPRLQPLNIVVSDHALKDSDVRLFPESRHRSRRIHKKLVKRHGGEFRKVPCMFKTPQGIIMHPALYQQLQAEMVRRQDNMIQGLLTGNRVPA